ncbi:hypothetical protein MML48_6g00012850 [Holotrichia oblita]|uniref:Uncharacterized protein n=2 Tax=Holotrichia oblita TaxID=644536 RepID=A0ACB9SWS3_HOLOL|nr:hypothetical protein MML48_6g00012799 [Holotrichia oblita]KAI4459011.1 hypothetical protein MML48_6g00012850 [Holotrichia oblita]
MSDLENNIEYLKECVLEKLKYGEDLLNSLSEFDHIEGAQKLHRKIKQELNFLRKVYKANSIKKEHLQCTNLTHFTALIKKLSEVENCIAVHKVFNLDDRKIVIDIVCDNGLSWMKVIARNPKSLSQICMGDSSYGVRSIFDQASEYIECAPLYPCLFQTPKVIFVFANGVGSNLAHELESLGILVEGDRINIDEEIEYETPMVSELSTKNTSHISKVNLDVSAMLAYVSSVTNGSCDKYEFSVPVLAQQADWECKRPVKPILDEFFKDKKLYCCETAKQNFINILNTVGGANERIRGFELLDRITVLPDDATASDTVECDNNVDIFNSVQYTPDKALSVGGKIRERSLIIFTFGDRIQAVTVTANDGFVRAAKQQGIYFVVFVHESRALTEQKESKAKLKL